MVLEVTGTNLLVTRAVVTSRKMLPQFIAVVDPHYVDGHVPRE